MQRLSGRKRNKVEMLARDGRAQALKRIQRTNDPGERGLDALEMMLENRVKVM